MKRLLFAMLLGLLSWNAAAQSSARCDDIGTAGSRLVSRETQQANAFALELVHKGGVDANLRSIRQQVLIDAFPKADPEVTLRRMLQEFCRIVWAAPDLAGDKKTARVKAAEDDILKRVQGPAEVARTNSRIRSGGLAPSQETVLATAVWIHQVSWNARGVEVAQSDATAAEFLRNPPLYVNDSNRYFVVVGSVPSEEGAIRRMNQLKAKAPQYDFVVYGPYGSNPNYAIMMATWVSKDVANQALHAARTAVVGDAYPWACRSSGESC